MKTLHSLDRISESTVLGRFSRHTGRGIPAKNLLSLVCAFLLVGAGYALTLGPGETLVWDTDAPAANEVIEATGGTIVFDSDVTVGHNFYLGGEVTVVINNDALVRFSKTFFQTDPSGRLVLPRTARFGSTDSAKYAFLPENSIAFAPDAVDATLRLAGWTSMLVLPDKWSNPVPYIYGTNVLVAFYGGYMVTNATYTLPEHTTIRMISYTNFPPTTVITVPASSTFQDRPAVFQFDTNSARGSDGNWDTVRSNDVVLAGGTFQILTGSTHKYWGNISGTGTINVGNQWPDSPRNTYHYFYGSVSGMDARSQLTIDQLGWDTDNANNGARLNSDFPGTVKINYSNGACRDIVSFGFNNPNTSGATNENWYVGAIQGGSVIGPRSGEGGARLQFSAKQHIHAGRLSGKLAIFATAVATALNSDDLTVDTVADDTILYVKNGIRMHFGTVGKGVKIRIMASPVSSNVVEVGSGTVEEISFLGTAAQQTKPVYLHGNVGLVSGPGKVIAFDGSRVGFVASNATVEVNSGAVTLGDEELFGSKPALWLDASDLSTYAPLYKSSYHNNGALHAPSTLLGADKLANVYTNDFPLVEKWYDKRPEQRLNFFWNDRWKYDNNTFYPQFYPFIIPNGLNGKPILSFGINRVAGASGLSSEWSQYGYPGQSNSSESRRLHLMQNPPEGVVAEGHAAYVHSCVMVFGSERGGGRCIFGGYNGNAGTAVNATHNPNCNDHFQRTGSGYSLTNGIFQAKIEGGKTNIYETWVNGTPVVCTNTPMSGSWDVITFHTDKAGSEGRAFRNIGCPQDTAQGGGQDYAEFLVYSNKLTEAERMSVESYLASKWGLEDKQVPVAGTVRVGANGSVTGSQRNITGTGSWTLRSYEEVTLDGQFTGTVSGPGKLKASAPAIVPTLSSAFTGELQFTGTPLSFTFSGGAVTNAITAENGTVTIPDEATVVLACASRPMPGTYPLVTVSAVTANAPTVQLAGDDAVINRLQARLSVTATTLSVDIIPSGTVISIR